LYGKIFSRVKSYLVPYFTYGILFALSSFLLLKLSDRSLSFKYLFGDFFNLLYGGSAMRGPYAVFWFINVLFLTYVVFAILNYLKIKKVYLGFLFFGTYLLAHLFFYFGLIGQNNIPWNADVVLVSLFYFYIGFVLKNTKTFLRHYRFLFFVLLFVNFAFIYLFKTGVFNFLLIMKYSQFPNPILGAIIPVTMTANLILFSKIIEKTKFARIFIFIGNYTMIIYFLHMPINQYLLFFTKLEYGVLIYTIVGVFVPIICGVIFSYSKVLSQVFLGRASVR
jgi:fucose 4-O-acetylase-like acetyltransferase